MTEEVIGKIMGQGGSSEEGQTDPSQDINLQELAELVFKKIENQFRYNK